MVNIIKRTCPVCHQQYEYPECGYVPKTCAQFDCVHKYAHYPERYKPFIDHLDECRKEAGI